MTTTEIKVIEPPSSGVRPLALAAPSGPASAVEQLIQLAIEHGQNPTELYAIMREERASQAVKAFARAKWEFLGKCAKIIENRKGGGITKGGAKFEFPYADMCDVLEQTLPTLQALGFSHGFSLVVLADGKQYQRCNFRHAGGHCETADVPYMADVGGHMNAVQQVGSGLTYSMRYALLAAIGLPTGQASPDSSLVGGRLSQDQTETILNLLVETKGQAPDFAAIYGVAKVADIPAKMFNAACDVLAKRAAAQRSKP